jgi:two-component system sensor histidine kinase/response regulator
LNLRYRTKQLLTYAAAIVGGLLLVVSFARFNALHEEFLGANFDSVHSARMLLKADFILELAARDLEGAIDDAARRPALLARAAEHLTLAESYGAEASEKDPGVRNALNTRLQALRSKLNDFRAVTPTTDLLPLLAATRQLAKDFGTAELERWGTLSSANVTLAKRMQQMRMFIVGIILLFVLIMLALGWALSRARRAEDDLLSAKAAIEAIQQTTLDASPIGIAYTDASDLKHRRIKAANHQMAKIFGYLPEQLLGLETSRLHADRATHERWRESMAPRLSAGEVVREEVMMQRKDGEPFWCSLSLKAIDPDDLSHGVVWTCEDISERKKTETQLQLAGQKAEAASLAKSDFLANMSHELRTPFAGILGLLDLLQRTDLSETQQRYTRLARDSTSQMLTIVNDILDFSKIEAGKLSLDPVTFDLQRFFSVLAETHTTTAARKELNFALDLVEPLPATLEGDTVRIRQIVDNLVSNALKFTLEGEVRLRVECTSSNAETVALKVTVSDTGIGLAPEIHEHIFEKFSQADTSTTRVFGGTGLGLAICQQLATLMGGRITVDSVLGEGCRFCLEVALPIAPALDAATLAGALIEETSGEPADDISGIVVLLVDDNMTNRNVFAELLGHYGCTVETAENGEQAILLAREIKPDVILMDCQMPLMDGREATRRIRAAEAPGERVAIVALTAHAINGDRESCLESGMDDYLPKPVSPEMLVRRIAQWAVRRNAETVNETALAEVHLSSPKAAAGRWGRILLVEDNPSIQEATRRLLEYSGCEVAVASHGQAALDILEAAHGTDDFALVLMDCRMQGMDGCETTRRWRQREGDMGLKPVTVIAVTGCDLPETKQNCRDAGMNDILVKPYPASSLTCLLDKWLGENPARAV